MLGKDPISNIIRHATVRLRIALPGRRRRRGVPVGHHAKGVTTYNSRDYLRHSQSSSVRALERIKIVDWCYIIVDQLELDRETVAMAMELVDRFLSQPGNAKHKALYDCGEYQLVAMASLYICVKTNERVALGSEFFAKLSYGTYTIEDIEGMELSILNGLSWRICSPTSIQMAHHILSLTLPCNDLYPSSWGLILDEV